jgi:hypothetical protein
MRKNLLLLAGIVFLLVMPHAAVLAGYYHQRLAGSVWIDLYTQEWRYPSRLASFTGQHQANGSQVDSYSPSEQVILCAEISYNDEPVSDVEVEFEIIGPTNQYYNVTIIRQSQTNASGIATISFKIPWPDLNPEQAVLGIWQAMAKASVANQEVIDVHSWHVEFLADFNCDEVVGPFDFARFSISYGSTPQEARWLLEADFDGDKKIGPYDFAFFSSRYGKRYP